MKNKFAFWEYDSFPFLMGAECHPTIKDGKVFVPSYGGYFKPVAVIDLEQGKKMKAELDELTARRNHSMILINIGAQKELENIKIKYL